MRLDPPCRCDTLSACLIFSVSLLLPVVGADTLAAPVVVNLDFVGPVSNGLEVGISGAGFVSSDINGKLVFPFTGTPSPQTDPVGLNPDMVTIGASPDQIHPTGSLSIESTTWTPLAISGVTIDLLNGTMPILELDQILIETNAPFDDPTIKFDVTAQVTTLHFFQDAGIAVFGPGNTYALPGHFHVVMDTTFDVDVFDGGLFISTGFGPQAFNVPATVEGVLDIIPTGPGQANLDFHGTFDEAIPLGALSTTVTFNSFGAVANISVLADATMNLAVDYHLHDTAQVPEPGTIALFGIGVLGIAPLVSRRLLKGASSARSKFCL